MSSAERTNPARPWCVCAAAAALAFAAPGTAEAQTVMVRSAVPGSSIEAVVNASPAGSATANAAGEATIPLSQQLGKNGVDANIFVDVCANNLRRVLIVERGQQPSAPGEGCDRKDIQGLYWVRHVSTIVVTMADPSPRVLLRQGSFSFKPPRVFNAPTGLVVFGAAGLSRVSDVGLFACGDVSGCTRKSAGFSFSGGVEYWLKPWLAAEGSYIRPAKATATGSGGNFRFDSSFTADVFSIAGKLAVPIARARLYGKVGGDFHDATLSTNETLDDRTITIDENTTATVKGGSQTYALRTQGWGLIFGGGLDIWITPSFGIYGEAGRGQLKGTGVDKADGSIDDHVNYVMVGIRVHIR